MATCPKCSASLKDDYGMVTCPSCGTLLLIDIDGNAFFGSENPPPAPEPVLAHDPASADSPAETHDFQIEEPAEPATDLPLDWSASEGPEAAEPPADFSDLKVEEEARVTQDLASAAPPEPEQEFNLDNFGYGTPDAAQDEPAAQIGTPGDPLGIEGYANSEVSLGKDGLLLFSVIISGIDSKEIRESLREAMEDERFAWDPNAIMAKIHKGVLVIEKMTPVKATILVNRFKRYPVQIRWEQYAITQMDGDSQT